MTPAQFADLLHDIQLAERQVRADGQREYAGSDDSAFGNFDRAAAALGIPREKVLLIYAAKHWDGILSWANGHRSQREDVRGRIKDLRLYLALLWGMADESDPIVEPDVDEQMDAAITRLVKS